MRLKMAQIFPITDEPSARLMKLKAACLFRAGIVTESQRMAVTRRADTLLAGSRFPRARGPSCNSRAA